MKTLFFLGKGGVGKSTCSALTALGLARAGFNCVLISLDPAHNIGDLFQRELGSKAVRIIRGLRAVEVDREDWLRRRLRTLEEETRRSYRYLTAFNLDHHFSLFRHAPGLENAALLLAFEDAIRRHADSDYLLVDMPPTASAMSFFTGPLLEVFWLEKLRGLRREILEKRELITRIKLGKREIMTDKILGRLERSIARSKGLLDFFRDSAACRMVLILNPGRLSLAEAGDILSELSDAGMGPQQVLLNKSKEKGEDEENFEGIPLCRMVRIDPPPVGLSDLERALGSFPLSQVAGSVVHYRHGG